MRTTLVVSKYGLLLSPNFDSLGLKGAPNIQIGGSMGWTNAAEGREDITGHLTDVFLHCREHQYRFGGEYRRAQLEEFYHRHGLGILSLMAQWTVEGDSADSKVKALADFLAGDFNPNTSTIRARESTRLVYVRPSICFSGRLAVFSQADVQLRSPLGLRRSSRRFQEGLCLYPSKATGISRRWH